MGNENTLQGLGLEYEELLLTLLCVIQQSSVVLNEAYFMGYKKVWWWNHGLIKINSLLTVFSQFIVM